MYYKPLQIFTGWKKDSAPSTIISVCGIPVFRGDNDQAIKLTLKKEKHLYILFFFFKPLKIFKRFPEKNGICKKNLRKKKLILKKICIQVNLLVLNYSTPN